MRTSLVLKLLVLGIAGHTSVVTAQSPGAFTPTGDMTTDRSGHTATLLANGKVLIAGGYRLVRSTDFTSSLLTSAELYDPSTGKFTATGNMTTVRAAQTATLLANGKVLIVGDSWDYTDPASAELYDPSTGTFTPTGHMASVRGVSSATLLNNGKVLIAGGGPASAELYDPFTGTFTLTGNMTVAGTGSNATLLPNGKVLFLGNSSSGAEVYDPDAGTFSPVPGTTSKTDVATATLLGNGKVLATLIDLDLIIDLVDLYDPSNGSSTAGNMTASRRERTATLLPDGKVLIAGGGDSALPRGSFSVTNMAGAELYDPAAGTFSPTGAMVNGRESFTATLLPDGTVLVAGGWACCGKTVASAEIYHPAVLTPSPVLLSLTGDGQGQGAIQHAGTYRIASAGDPAVAGEYLSIYLTGLAEGSVIPPQVAIGGRLAEITFFGNVPGYPGLDVVNVRVPSGVLPGPAVSVRLTYLNRPSNAVTIGVL